MASPRDTLPGTVIDGRYRILRVLARGGMGLVYDAVHVALDRPLAFKVLAPELAESPTAVERLLREARAAGRLDGAHVAAVHDVGRLEDGRPYLVMDRLDGVDLGQVIEEQGSLDPHRVVELLRGPAAALTKAHQKGIVHRDIKPDNLVLVGCMPDTRLVLIDFGLAAFCTPGPALERLTRAGLVIGTPAYMAPECVEEAPPAPACDVYGLAAVAFEMITGSPPFSIGNPVELMSVKCRIDAPKLADVTGSVFPDVLEAAIAQGLARRPEERFATPNAFAMALAEAMRIASSPDAAPADRWRRPTRDFALAQQRDDVRPDRPHAELDTQDLVPAPRSSRSDT